MVFFRFQIYKIGYRYDVVNTPVARFASNTNVCPLAFTRLNKKNVDASVSWISRVK